MFLEKVFSGKNDIGRWFALIMIVMAGIFVAGVLPLGITMFLKLNDNTDLIPDPENSLDLGSYDISPETGLALTIFPFITGLAALMLLIKVIHERPVLSLLTGANFFRWKRFFWALLIWFLLLGLYTVFSVTAGFQKIQLQYQPQNFILLMFVSIILLPFQVVFEETFFRGYLMQGFTKLFLNKWMPVLITAVLFVSIQYFYPQTKAFGLRVTIPFYLWTGIFLGLCTVMDEGLEIAMGIHVVNTIFLSVLFTDQSNAIQTPALFNIIDTNFFISITGLIFISLLFLQLARLKYSWPEWKNLFIRIEEPFVPEEKEYDEEIGLWNEGDDNN